MKYKPKKNFRSFREINPPINPEESAVLWTDWMEARADWCEDFARVTRATYRSVDKDPRHHLVLSDYDHYMHRNFLNHGVDYKRLMRHFDRFEIYMADDHRLVKKRELLANVKYNVKHGLEIAGKKPFQFHTWFTDAADFTPMKPGLLEAMVECAAENGAEIIEIYTFKVHDWRGVRGTEKMMDGRPPFKEVSLKYHPSVLKRIRKMIANFKRR